MYLSSATTGHPLTWRIPLYNNHKAVLAQRTCQNIKRARASVNASDVKGYFTNLQKTIQDADNPPPTHIFNYDETNLSDDLGVKKCVFKRGVKYPESSAAGNTLPPYVVH